MQPKLTTIFRLLYHPRIFYIHYFRADSAVKTRIKLENDNSRKEEENDKLETQLKEINLILDGYDHNMLQV